MRGAYCVMRVASMCIGLVACSNADVALTAQPVSTPHAESPQTPAPVSVQDALKPTGTDCIGDTNQPVVAANWKLLWQKVFDHPIAYSPIVDSSQILLIERAGAHPATLQDTVLIVDSQTGNIQWKITDAKEPVPQVAREVKRVLHSSQYWLALIQYIKPQGQPNPNPVAYEVVINRVSGDVVYDSSPIGSDALALSDNMLVDYSATGENMFSGTSLRLVDLPASTIRWENPSWDSRASHGIYVLNNWLYDLSADNILQYNLVDGKLVNTVPLGIPRGEEIIEGQLVIERAQDIKNEGIGVFDLQRSSPLWRVKVDYLPDEGSNAFWSDFLGYVPSITSTPDSVYLFDAHDTLLRLDLKTGKRVWQTPSPGPQAMSRPAIVMI